MEFIESIFEKGKDGRKRGCGYVEKYLHIYVMLEAYRSLPSVLKSIDRYVFLRAMTSHNYDPCVFSATDKQFDEIFAVLEKKTELLDMRDALRNGFKSLSVFSLKAIYARYIHGMSVAGIASLLNSTESTVSRRIRAGVRSLNSSLLFAGYDREWFEKSCLSQRWILRLYQRLKAAQEHGSQASRELCG